VEHLIGYSLGLAPALPTNIGLGWRGLRGTNTLAYYETPYITTAISYIVQAPGITNKYLTCNKSTLELIYDAASITTISVIKVRPVANVIKLFTAVSYALFIISYRFVPAKPFQTCLLFVGKAMSLPLSGAPESGFNWAGSGLTRKHWGRLVRFAYDK
jgi:hypothetical protein